MSNLIEIKSPVSEVVVSADIEAALERSAEIDAYEERIGIMEPGKFDPAIDVTVGYSAELGSAMNTDAYRRTLLSLRSQYAERLDRDIAGGREQNVADVADSADAATIDESESADFGQAELDSVTLEEIDAALQRIEDGTYGRCLVDGGPIEAKRLDAVPWAVYCIKHQRAMEAASRPKPTL